MKPFKCNSCGLLVEAEIKPLEWVSFTEVVLNGIRLFERARTPRYESFHIPNKEEKFYCTKNCAFNSLKTSIEVFLSEIQSLSSGSRGL